MEFQSDYSKIKHLIDYDGVNELEFSEGTISRQNGGADGCGQTGGVGNMLDNLDNFEKDFFEIFQKAKEYRHRITNSLNTMQQEMHGGDNGVKKAKKPLNAAIAMTVATGKSARANSYIKQLLGGGKLKNTDIFKLGGMIMKEAKKNVSERKKVPIEDLKGSNPDVMAEYKALDEKAQKDNYKKYVDPLVAANAKQMSRVSRNSRLQMY